MDTVMLLSFLTVVAAAGGVTVLMVKAYRLIYGNEGKKRD